MNLNPAHDQGCPPEEAWFAICGGQIDEIEAQRLLSHAADCATCGPRLREATVNWVQEASSEEKDFVASLRSSSEGWQKKLASRLQRESKSKPQRRSRMGQFFWPVAAAVAAAAVFAVIWVYRQNHSPDVLLARVYDQQRLTDLRIPGGRPVPLFSPLRGSSSKQESPELLEARLLAERGLRANPTNPYWHQVLGRIDVVEMDPESALAELQLAETREPNLPRIQFDLGTAYYELGERTGDTSNYGYAAERFSRYLESVKNRDPVALYNRALCWKKTGVRELAEKDLKEAINLEPNVEWRRAMEEELRRLSGPDSQSKNHPPLSLDKSDNYETEQLQALEDDLTKPMPEAILQIGPVARIGNKHGDYWLTDWIIASRRRRSIRGDVNLSDAVRESLAGDASQALQDSVSAERFYQEDGNSPGLVRSRAEEVYALRRMGRPKDCLQKLEQLTKSRLSRYSWLSTDLALEHATCLFQIGWFDEAQAQAQIGLNAATSAGLPLLALRARGYSSSFQTAQGLAEQGWRMNVLGLSVVWPRTQPMRRYQFLSDLALDASDLGLSYVAASLAGECARSASQTGNIQIAAYAWELLGRDQLAVGQRQEAKRSFGQADATLIRLGENRATTTYNADWSTDRAELQLSQGQGQLGIEGMDHALPSIEQTHDLLIGLNYWARRAQVESKMGRTSGALSSAENAVAFAESALHPLNTREERRAWQLNSQFAYLALINSLIDSHRPGDALAEWLSFRAAPELIAVSSVGAPTSQMAPFEQTWNGFDSEVLVYVRLPSRYVVFTITGKPRNVRAVAIKTDPDQVDQMVRTFTTLCSDPSSDTTEIQALGRELYEILLTPIPTDGSKELRIDTSSTLGRLPFAALVAPDRRYFGEDMAIVHLPEWWSVGITPTSRAVSVSSRFFVVDANSGLSEMPSIPTDYDESAPLASMFPNREILDRPQSLREILPGLKEADLFHFVGHASSHGSASALSLATPAGQDPVVLTPSSLDGITLPHCQVVFLAACSTLGEEPHRIEEPFSLPSAFLRAGVADVVASRWNVDSEASKLFALNFYQELLKGKSPASALERGQQAVRSQRKFEHPYYWSAFCLLEQ